MNNVFTISSVIIVISVVLIKRFNLLFMFAGYERFSKLTLDRIKFAAYFEKIWLLFAILIFAYDLSMKHLDVPYLGDNFVLSAFFIFLFLTIFVSRKCRIRNIEK
jgi:hypothetical protein